MKINTTQSWTLVDRRSLNQRYPTLYHPTNYEAIVDYLADGGYVQLLFKSKLEKENSIGLEKIWLKTAGYSKNCFWGTVVNIPLITSELGFQTLVPFHPGHVMEYDAAHYFEHKVYAEAVNKKCRVSKKVISGEAIPRIMVRELSPSISSFNGWNILDQKTVRSQHLIHETEMVSIAEIEGICRDFPVLLRSKIGSIFLWEFAQDKWMSKKDLDLVHSARRA